MRAALLCAGFVWAAGAAASPAFGPEEFSARRGPAPAVRESASTLVAGLSAWLQLWHAALSPVDGPKCPMYPTCSAYCGLAMRRYGAPLGLVMTAARLLKETPDLPARRHYPLRLHRGTYRFYDPPERDEL